LLPLTNELLAILVPDAGMKMSWKGWLGLASRHRLCLHSWPDTIPCPGPLFDIAKLVSSQVLILAQPFIDEDNGTNEGRQMVTIERWSEGTSVLPFAVAKLAE
jgi:hypothetical protein